MYSLSVHLTSPHHYGGEPLPLEEQRKVIALLNMLLRKGFVAYFRDPILNIVTPVTKMNERTIDLTRYPIWAMQSFDKMPQDIIDELNGFKPVTYTLQKLYTPSH